MASYTAFPGLVSVIIPVYNTAAYLERSVGSVLDNTYQNIEVLCINDGSTDNSQEILTSLAQRDTRVRVINQENGGVSYARNRGLKEAKGEYVCFVDSDDWIHRQFFEVLLSAGDADILIGNFQENYDGDTTAKNIPIKNVISRRLQVSEAMGIGFCRNSVCGRLFKGELIKNKSFPEGIPNGEDQIFETLIYSSLIAPSIAQINIPIYYYYSREGSAIHTYAENAYLNVSKWYLQHTGLFEQKTYMIMQIFRCIFTYRYEGSLGNNKKEVRCNSRRIIRTCIPMLMKDSQIPVVEKI